MKKSEPIDTMVVTSDDATKKTLVPLLKKKKTLVPHARLTSFLEKDHSFLTPWSWNPKTCENEANSTKEKEYLYFHHGSYLSNEVIFS